MLDSATCCRLAPVIRHLTATPYPPLASNNCNGDPDEPDPEDRDAGRCQTHGCPRPSFPVAPLADSSWRSGTLHGRRHRLLPDPPGDPRQHRLAAPAAGLASRQSVSARGVRNRRQRHRRIHHLEHGQKRRRGPDGALRACALPQADREMDQRALDAFRDASGAASATHPAHPVLARGGRSWRLAAALPGRLQRRPSGALRPRQLGGSCLRTKSRPLVDHHVVGMVDRDPVDLRCTARRRHHLWHLAVPPPENRRTRVPIEAVPAA